MTECPRSLDQGRRHLASLCGATKRERRPRCPDRQRRIRSASQLAAPVRRPATRAVRPDIARAASEHSRRTGARQPAAAGACPSTHARYTAESSRTRIVADHASAIRWCMLTYTICVAVAEDEDDDAKQRPVHDVEWPLHLARNVDRAAYDLLRLDRVEIAEIHDAHAHDGDRGDHLERHAVDGSKGRAQTLVARDDRLQAPPAARRDPACRPRGTPRQRCETALPGATCSSTHSRSCANDARKVLTPGCRAKSPRLGRRATTLAETPRQQRTLLGRECGEALDEINHRLTSSACPFDASSPRSMATSSSESAIDLPHNIFELASRNTSRSRRLDRRRHTRDGRAFEEALGRQLDEKLACRRVRAYGTRAANLHRARRNRRARPIVFLRSSSHQIDRDGTCNVAADRKPAVHRSLVLSSISPDAPSGTPSSHPMQRPRRSSARAGSTRQPSRRPQQCCGSCPHGSRVRRSPR